MPMRRLCKRKVAIVLPSVLFHRVQFYNIGVNPDIKIIPILVPPFLAKVDVDWKNN